MQNNFTLTDVERFLIQYPEVWKLYKSNKFLLLTAADTLSNEFQIYAELNFCFWKIAETLMKNQNAK